MIGEVMTEASDKEDGDAGSLPKNSVDGVTSSNVQMHGEAPDTDQLHEFWQSQLDEASQPDARFWEYEFEKWQLDQENSKMPGRHPWPNHLWNTHPEMYTY